MLTLGFWARVTAEVQLNWTLWAFGGGVLLLLLLILVLLLVTSLKLRVLENGLTDLVERISERFSYEVSILSTRQAAKSNDSAQEVMKLVKDTKRDVEELLHGQRLFRPESPSWNAYTQPMAQVSPQSDLLAVNKATPSMQPVPTSFNVPQQDQIRIQPTPMQSSTDGLLTVREETVEQMRTRLVGEVNACINETNRHLWESKLPNGWYYAYLSASDGVPYVLREGDGRALYVAFPLPGNRRAMLFPSFSAQRMPYDMIRHLFSNRFSTMAQPAWRTVTPAMATITDDARLYVDSVDRGVVEQG